MEAAGLFGWSLSKEMWAPLDPEEFFAAFDAPSAVDAAIPVFGEASGLAETVPEAANPCGLAAAALPGFVADFVSDLG